MDERRMPAPWQLITYMKQRSKDNRDFIALDCGNSEGPGVPPPRISSPSNFKSSRARTYYGPTPTFLKKDDHLARKGVVRA